MTNFVIKKLPSKIIFLLLSIFICMPASANTVSSLGTRSLTDHSAAKHYPSENVYVASNNSIQQLFSVLGGALRKPFIVSVEAAKKRVSGNFDINNPVEILDTVSARTGLIWYDDGSSVYIYDAAELKSTVVSLVYAPFERLVNYLKTTGLYDPRFPLRSDGQSGSFYISGPPVYVDLVISAAKYIDATYAQPGSGESTIRVIKLKNAFVNDRTFTLRDNPVNVPGVATVLNQLLNSTTGGQYAGETASITVDNDTQMALQAADASQKGNFPSLPMLKSNHIAKASTQPRSLDQQPIRIVAYSDTNSLLVQGSARQVSFVEDLVSAIDIPKQQIQLSLWIIDISKSEINDLGIKWQATAKVNGSGVTFNSSTLTPQNSFQFLAGVHALVSNGNAQVVARPEILTQENVPALFDNNSSFYAKLVGERNSSLEKVTYGTMISVLPRIAQRQQEIEMILNIQDGGLPQDPDGSAQYVDSLPVVNNTQISTEARVPIGYSLLVGGYTRNHEERHRFGIPLLRDIPYAGRLFDYSYSTQDKMVRLFLIQPTLLMNGHVWEGRSETNPILGRTLVGKLINLQSTVSMLRRSMK